MPDSEAQSAAGDLATRVGVICPDRRRGFRSQDPQRAFNLSLNCFQLCFITSQFISISRSGEVSTRSVGVLTR